MNVLTTTFWGEGATDDRFFPQLLQKTLEQLLLDCANGDWDIYEPTKLSTDKGSFVEACVDIYQQSEGFRIAFIHTDADAKSEGEKALPNKVEPAKEAISKLHPNESHPCITWVIPVTKQENWKLADLEAIEETLGVTIDWNALKLNISPAQREGLGKSKEALNAILKQANQVQGGRQRFGFDLHDLEEPLVKNISLAKLAKFDSFQAFCFRLRECLLNQNIISPDCFPSFL